MLTDPKKRQTFDLLTASALIGRPYIVPKAVPADRFAALRAAFDATMKDPEFIADADQAAAHRDGDDRRRGRGLHQGALPDAAGRRGGGADDFGRVGCSIRVADFKDFLANQYAAKPATGPTTAA